MRINHEAIAKPFPSDRLDAEPHVVPHCGPLAY